MDRRSRTKVCVWLILLGLGNFLAYGIGYALIGGDAPNGAVRDNHYYVRGHFIHFISGQEQEVSRGVWIYSYIHSISIWPSIAVVLLALFALARPYIIATYQNGIIKGSTLVTAISTLIIFITGIIMIVFTVEFLRTQY
ncbi:MAG: hypothetical protein H6819_07340 [Phycisphaerales bacterium]|nr:hypothetical protein [Phycisphaerales bacterium]MCB9857692.1 hypothetical protein [Phycisphaerales bacterium]MCB9864781.1 hypothetical protein [Phycisphaerales bacterium]